MIGWTASLLAVAVAQAASQPPSFGVGVDAVYVDVFVTDAGRPVTGLGQSDFELREDGRRREVEWLSLETLPLSTFLVLDTSGSVAGEKLGHLQRAGLTLLEGLRPGDEAALVRFGPEVELSVPKTRELARVERGLRGIMPGGSTPLWDALYAGTLLASGPGRALLVLFTDGEDNVSWLDAAELRSVLERSNVLVQIVGIVPALQQVAVLGPQQPQPIESPYVRTLRRLAEPTGGRFWPAASPERLADAFASLLEAMRSRYLLRFEPAAPQRPGLHTIDVRLTRQRGKVHCRRTYFIDPASR